MHVGIRNQLSAFVLLVSLTSLGVLAIVTWFNNQSLVTDLRRSRLALIATLKSEQIASDINLLQSAVVNVASRAQVLNAIKRYTGESTGGVKNQTYANWNTSLIDMSLVLSTQLALQHVTVFSADFKTVYLNVTSQGVLSENTPGLVPINDATGNPVGFNSILGHPGFPDELFPKSPPSQGNLLLGPVRSLTNSSAQIASITTPIYNNTTAAVADKSILGYVTVICSLFSVENTVSDYTDLGETYKYFLLGPSNGNIADESSGWPGNVSWRYVIPPITSTAGQGTLGGFWGQIGSTPDFMGSIIDTRNPANDDRVAIGFSPVNYGLVDWIFVVQIDYSEVSQPITHLRNLLLATVFGTAAGVVIVTCILASYAIRPIARLRDATEKTTRPPGYSPTAYDSETEDPPAVFGAAAESTVDESLRRRRPWWKRGLTTEKFERRDTRNRKERSFRVPEKVPDKKHIITDELTELTRTFNEMTDELVKQYTHLEERVATRTAELKEQTQLANAANDAKSMFIANVTHELRTPLNGILGMCSVMLTEPNLGPGIKRSLNTIYKSGDLLLCLLTDLLTFSRNQVAGVNVVLEEGEFHTRDLVTQVRAIFVKTARDKGVELGVEIINDSGNPELGEPSINGVLRGDLNRVLQVVINLLSNALKFTPEKGSVQLRIAMLKDTKGVALSTEDTPQKDMPTLKMPQTAMINPNTPANMALKAKREATSLTIPSLTTPGELSNSSTTEAYFGSAGYREGEEEAESEEGRPPAEDPRIRVRWFEFSVIDTGPGIPSHMHTKIFEPFVQGDLGLSKKYGGTGLGLSICKQLAEIMGGVIELKSFEGAGSTFTLRIPLKAGGFATQPPLGYSRPGSLATTRYTRNLPPNLRPRGDIDNVSTKTASTAFSSISGGPADATRLVGLSQPFFAPEVPPEDGNFSTERRPSRAEKQSAAQRQSKVSEHSPPPPPLPTIPPYSEVLPSGQETTSTEIIISARRPALERTSSSPAMMTPRSTEGFTAAVRKPSDDQGKPVAVLVTSVGNGGAPSPTALSRPPGLLPTPSTAESAAPRTPAPAVTISPSKSVKISKAVFKQPETAGESSTAPKKDKRALKDLKDLKDKRASIKVLVAEDNRVNIQVIKKMLRLEAVSDVTLAEDGAVAVEKVKEALAIGKKFDIILMDIQMPNMDGLQATKAIREMGYTSAICALTAFAEQSNVKECFDAGMDYFLAKPIKKNELRKVLQLYGSSSKLNDPEFGGPSSSAAAAGPSESA
ncbi:Histidine kinase [Orbilia ellipsospora]|uniref:histidine kinase n=1 Tax=Orbilia ellipsospora TaxID=2528407 RepID=A0AAV9X8X7_9PEZI